MTTRFPAEKEKQSKSYLSGINPDWSVVPFGRLIVSSEYGLSTASSEMGNIPILKMNSIADGKLNLRELDRTSCSPQEIQRFRIRTGDILFNRTNSFDLVGKTAVVSADADIVFASYLVRFRVIPGVDPRFVGYWFNSDRGQQRLKELATPGVSQSNINPTRLQSDFRIPLPPLPEQRRIAKILTTWDDSLEKLDVLTAAQERRKQGLMQQLLTGRRRLKRFVGKWTNAKLGDLFTERVEQNRIDLPLLSITADRGVVPRGDLAKRDTSSEDKSKYLRIAPGDIGYNTMRMWQGVSALSHFEGIISPAYTVCIPSSRIDGRFAAHFFKLRHTVHQFHRFSQGLVDDTLNLKFPNFAVIKVRIPTDVAEQRAIATVLDVQDEEICLLRAQRTALDQQKRGLMQRLLTGQARVKGN